MRNLTRRGYVAAGNAIRDAIVRLHDGMVPAYQTEMDGLLTDLCRRLEVGPEDMVRRIVGTDERRPGVSEDVAGPLWAAIPIARAALDREAEERARPACVTIAGEPWHTDGYSMWRTDGVGVECGPDLTHARERYDGRDVTAEMPEAFDVRLRWRGALVLARPDGEMVTISPRARRVLRGAVVHQAGPATGLLRAVKAGRVVAYTMPMWDRPEGQ